MQTPTETTARPLEGIRIANFAQAMAGSLAASFLSSFGATVVKIESHTKIDWMRQSGPFVGNIQKPDYSVPYLFSNAGGQLGITLNLKKTKGKDIAKRIVRSSDVVIENFAGGVMAKLGLGYNDLKDVKPDIIMVSASIYGETGPFSRVRGYGTTLTALTGFAHLTGYPEEPPQLPSAAFTDFITPRIIALAVLAALDYRRKTGKGQFIDVAQLEAAIPLLTPVLLEYQVNGRELVRDGNRSTRMAPCGVYPCKGEDKWCTICIMDDQQWQTFVEVVGRLDWATDSKYATFLSRVKHMKELNTLIAKWTINYTAEEVMTLMQHAGIAAGVAQTGSDLAADPQLKARRFFQDLAIPEIGRFPFTGMAPRLSKTPFQFGRTPLMGEHNEYVYTNMFGMSDEEFVKLDAEGIFE